MYRLLGGLGHYRMRGDYRVVSATDWDRWLAEQLARLGR
jgi:heme/copper-type cytochrome/quinol oxidase subunit 2